MSPILTSSIVVHPDRLPSNSTVLDVAEKRRFRPLVKSPLALVGWLDGDSEVIRAVGEPVSGHVGASSKSPLVTVCAVVNNFNWFSNSHG